MVLSQVFEETLRMVPPAPIVTKKAPRGLTLSGYSVPEGTTVWVSGQHWVS